MNILIVGSGGREHALAWKAAQSPRCSKLFTAPGNAGTAELGQNVPIAVEDIAGLVAFSVQEKIDLVIVGPEAALGEGLVDALHAAGIPAFGPTQAAARIETSKAFAKQFMARHGIPSARFAVFTDYEAARKYLEQVPYPVVIKASGLAAGKGVILPETLEEGCEALHAMLVGDAFGRAGEEVIIEERLSGEEISLLAFSDGRTVRPMPPAQDHKRLLDDDQGPNTGGMGAYAPAPICPPAMAAELTKRILQPAVDGLRAEGCPFVGVLYAGLILTDHGPRVLEFNCRFGDPETQVLLPLLEDDLVEIALACVEQRLESCSSSWRAGSAATVVLASQGYPGKYERGMPIEGLEHLPEGALVFHAGTQIENNRLITAGGRVLNVTGIGEDLRSALGVAYRAIEKIHFTGMQYRLDIGRRGLQQQDGEKSAYGESGVDIDAGNRAVSLMREAVRATYSPEVLSGIGAFGGLYDAGWLKSMQNPVLVASTDGVGTKVRLAAMAGCYETVGADIVNHCINDILVQGARPLFFLDYFATAHLDPGTAAAVVRGIAGACRESGCALLGGETAEMPGVYRDGEFDVAGTIIGVVEREKILPRSDIAAGDLLVGLASSGPHTNGYSLIRKIFEGIPLETVIPELGIPLSEALLAPHRSYLPVLQKALALDPSPVKALAHITGGGFIENIPRVLPEGLRAVIHRQSWPVPLLFSIIQARGEVDSMEMYRVFNMGIGMVIVTAPGDLERLQAAIDEPSWVIGVLEQGAKGVTFR